MANKLEYKMGSYGVEAFYNTRFKLLYKNLNKKNREKFKKMNLKEKKLIINKLIQKGSMI